MFFFGLSFFLKNENYLTLINLPSTNFQNSILAFSFIYYWIDLYYGYKFQFIKLEMIIHHGIMIVLLFSHFFYNKHHLLFCFVYMFGEASSIFLFPFENCSMYKRTNEVSKVLGFIFCIVFLFM